MAYQVDCVLMPVVRREWTALIRQLQSMPAPTAGANKPVLVISLDADWLEEEKVYLRRVLAGVGLENEFARIDFFSCKIPAHQSVYLKHRPSDMESSKLKYGWKSGPNLQFFRSVEYVKQQFPSSQALLLMETDLIPLGGCWLDRLSEELADNKEFLLAGARYSGGTIQSKNLKNHINGNAVLNLSHPDFSEFLATWEQLLIACMPIAPENPYDVIIEWALAKRTSLTEPSVAALVERMEKLYLPRRKYIASIVNLGGPHESAPAYRFPMADTLARFPQAVLLHCRAALPFVGQLRRASRADSDVMPQEVPVLESEELVEEVETDDRMDAIARAVLANVNRGPHAYTTLALMYSRRILVDAEGFGSQLSQNRMLRQAFEMTLNGADIEARSRLLTAMLHADFLVWYSA